MFSSSSSSCAGAEEGGVPPGALRPLQPHRPLPGPAEGLRVRGRGQGAPAPGLKPRLRPGGRHGALQEDAGAHGGAAGRRRGPAEEGKRRRRVWGG